MGWGYGNGIQPSVCAKQSPAGIGHVSMALKKITNYPLMLHLLIKVVPHPFVVKSYQLYYVRHYKYLL